MTQEMDEKEFEEWWLHTSFDFMPSIVKALKETWLASRRLLREKEGKDG